DGPALAGADAVPPVVAADEIAAGVADEAQPQGFQGLDNVEAEAIAIRARVARLEQAAVDAPAQVLDESAEDPPVDRPHVVVQVQVKGCAPHRPNHTAHAATAAPCARV